MGDIITYSLKLNDKTSYEYYMKVSTFTDEVMFKLSESTDILVKDFQDYIIENDCEAVRSKDEYSFELLTLGVLWIKYIDKALILGKIPKVTLNKLVDLRGIGGFTKIAVDYIRGFLGRLFLLKEKSQLSPINRTVENMNKLLDWLDATGEFNQEIKRLKHWQDYLSSKSKEEASNIILIALDLAKWFEYKSRDRLGCFTENVERFLTGTYKRHKWKEDNVYCGRKRIEYHLNMVGAEIMNRVFREDFLKTKEKILLLPACMRFQSKRNCKAIENEEGQLCTGCTSKCKANHLIQMGRKHNFRVLIIPHESTAFKNTKIEKNEKGIVGVACVLGLISGGWKAKELGFVPQCVLLDYCGCKNHWHEEGIITDINVHKLMDILNISKAVEAEHEL
ncbi:hypothetical protein CLPU_14c00380 [Gottschalkia purinilytica]|uniref:DUF116 domain-containing protein n=1 Tax=Gottschalkia purinilytica TaxID=1503 RepID=A0A0L0W8L5_GOTPU|nr:DUF116 domain-containing protein [Gottschalkia purinilytica]KNF07620.1 hypothetical protein CLPU_14c00380 [Gottschalkia purinilytica]